jgi:hypothetical protein
MLDRLRERLHERKEKLDLFDETNVDRLDNPREASMMGGFGGIGMVLWIGLIVAAIWWIAQAATNRRAPGQKADTF